MKSSETTTRHNHSKLPKALLLPSGMLGGRRARNTKAA